MATTRTLCGHIETEKLTNSANGNPRYRVKLYAPCEVVTGRTKSDSMFAYVMPRDGNARCTWHETPSGRVVFDNVEVIKA